jgi:hypothetical protein
MITFNAPNDKLEVLERNGIFRMRNLGAERDIDWVRTQQKNKTK